MAASDRFGIKVIGRQTHGSAPWNGVDPIVATADLVGTAQTIVSRRANLSKQPAVLTFGAINGGIRYNIIPDEVEMVGTIRTFDEGMRQQIFADLRNVAEHTAAAHGAKAVTEIYEADGNPATVNNPALTAKMLPSLQAVVGKDNVYEPPLQMGAEDFSLYAKEVPGMFFFVGSTSAGIDPATAPANHSPKFLLDEKALDVGLRAAAGEPGLPARCRHSCGVRVCRACSPAPAGSTATSTSKAGIPWDGGVGPVEGDAVNPSMGAWPRHPCRGHPQPDPPRLRQFPAAVVPAAVGGCRPWSTRRTS
jgi:hypothetical protein